MRRTRNGLSLPFFDDLVGQVISPALLAEVVSTLQAREVSVGVVQVADLTWDVLCS